MRCLGCVGGCVRSTGDRNLNEMGKGVIARCVVQYAGGWIRLFAEVHRDRFECGDRIAEVARDTPFGLKCCAWVGI